MHDIYTVWNDTENGSGQPGKVFAVRTKRQIITQLRSRFPIYNSYLIRPFLFSLPLQPIW